MSILIKGMGMPKSCYDCEIRIKCGCKVANDSGWLNNKIDDHCPFAFVEVPKHGRLIDADALEATVQDLWMENEISNSDWIGFRETLNSIPTVIEAED